LKYIERFSKTQLVFFLSFWYDYLKKQQFFVGDMAESVDATDLKVLFKLSLLLETIKVIALKFRETMTAFMVILSQLDYYNIQEVQRLDGSYPKKKTKIRFCFAFQDKERVQFQKTENPLVH
jgi:hypothetical protein